MSVEARMEHPFPLRKFSVIALEKLAGADSDDSGLSATSDTPSPTELSEVGEMDIEHGSGLSSHHFPSSAFDDASINWKSVYPTDPIDFDPESMEMAQVLQSFADHTTDALTDAPIFFPEAIGPYGYPVVPWDEYSSEEYQSHENDLSNNWELGPQQPIDTVSASHSQHLAPHPIMALPGTAAFKDIDFFASGNMDWLLSLTSQPNAADFPGASRYAGNLFPVAAATQPNAPVGFLPVPVAFHPHAEPNSAVAAEQQQSPHSRQFPAVNPPAFHALPQTPPATPKYDLAGELYGEMVDAAILNEDDDDNDDDDDDDDGSRRFSLWSDYFGEASGGGGGGGAENEMAGVGVEVGDRLGEGALSPGWRDAGSCVETVLSLSPTAPYDALALPAFSPFYFGGDGGGGAHEAFPDLPPMPPYPIAWAE